MELRGRASLPGSSLTSFTARPQSHPRAEAVTGSRGSKHRPPGQEAAGKQRPVPVRSQEPPVS